MDRRLKRDRVCIASLALASVIVICACESLQTARADDDGPVLRLPGHPDIPLPPNSRIFGPGQGGSRGHQSNTDIYHEFGTVTPGGGRRAGRVPDDGGMVIGPGGVIATPHSDPPRQVAKPRPPTLQEKQAQIRKALRPPAPSGVVRRKALDELYAKLAASTDAAESKRLAETIETVWAHSGSPTTDLLSLRAEQAISGKNYDLALQLLDRVVRLQPDWAEGWNKRASVRYLSGDLNGATADVDRVLKLEPNHFAALNGLALILQRTGFDKRALQVYRRELSIYPHQPALEELVEKLATQVEGQGI